MAYNPVQIGDTGQEAADKINGMFYELFNQVLFTWKAAVEEIRAIENYKNGDQIGLFGFNAVYEFDETSTDPDDGFNILKPNNLDVSQAGRWLLKVMFADRDKIQNLDGTSYAQITDTKFDIVTQGTGTQTIFSIKQGTPFTPIWIDANGKIYLRDPASIARLFDINADGLYFHSWSDQGNYIKSYAQQLGGDAIFRMPVANGPMYFIFSLPGANADRRILNISDPNGTIYIFDDGLGVSLLYTKYRIIGKATDVADTIRIGWDEVREAHRLIGHIDLDIQGFFYTYDGTSNVPIDTERRGGHVFIDSGRSYRTGDTNEWNISHIFIGHTIGNVKIGGGKPANYNDYPKEKLEVYGTIKTQGVRVQLETLTVNKTLGKSDHYIIADATNGDVIITLPDTSVGDWHGQCYVICRKDNTANNVIVQDFQGNELYNVSTNEKLNLIYDSVSSSWLNW